uniref:Si:ch211-39f2.3 n=1 Tax=Echeneis naucrates TaxID=173247 RepID=A0A665WKI9_ECHNA
INWFMYSQVNHNGHLTFDGPWSRFTPVRFPMHGNRDIIAPFWTDLDNRGNGYVLYNQYTSGSVLQQATRDINTYFPGLQFTASWVFVASWYQVAYYPTTGTVTQAVLISGGQYSFVLMNYGPIAATSHNVQYWNSKKKIWYHSSLYFYDLFFQAGYDTENSTNHFTIPGSFSSQASGTNSVIRFSSNVNVTGRWAFRTDHGSRVPLYPVSGILSQRIDDGSSPLIALQRPFVYFGHPHTQIYVNHNGHLTFDGPWSRFAPVRFPIHGNRDIIAPFWTDLDNRGNGYVLYNQYTSGSVLQQATRDINTYFPGLQFTASWVFVASWYQVAYYPTTGTVSHFVLNWKVHI